MKILKSVIVWSFILVITSCSLKTGAVNEASSLEDLFEADRAFSKLSEETSMGEAFVIYAADDAVILRENSMPIVGKHNISDLFDNNNSIKLTWEPVNGDIASSGDLGYTFGTFELKIDTLISVGTYVSIWKKQPNGEWRYVLDTGNEGLGN